MPTLGGWTASVRVDEQALPERDTKVVDNAAVCSIYCQPDRVWCAP
jgi:hypothetical protein